MDQDEFWSLIAESGGDPDGLERLLTGRDKEQLEAFDRSYFAQLARAYTWDLWGAGYLLIGGMSDDVDNEELRYAADKAYEETHGSEVPLRPADFPDDLKGEEWDEEDLDALEARFPRVAAKAG